MNRHQAKRAAWLSGLLSVALTASMTLGTQPSGAAEQSAAPTFITPAPPGAGAYDPPEPSTWPIDSEHSQNLSRLPGTVATATSQAMVPPLERWQPSNAIDGDMSTRWSSDNALDCLPKPCSYDPTNDYLQVEFAEPHPIHHIDIYWETARPSRYVIQVSQDGTNWIDVVRVVGAPEPTDSHIVAVEDPVKFVRVQGLERATQWGYSIWEIDVWDGPERTYFGEAGRVLPVPVTQVDGAGSPFELTGQTRLAVSDDSLKPLADLLARYLRPSTGFVLPVTADPPASGDIALVQADVPGLPDGDALASAEGYKLEASSTGVTLTAPAEHGLFNAFQTLRQLLPEQAYSNTPRTGPWQVADTTIVDYPRFGYRGLMIDPARNFLTVPEVKAIIDGLAAMKGSQLHVHLTDSQSWRLEIEGPPGDPDKYARLTGSGGCHGNPCRSGSYTQQDFRNIVSYANARFVEVIPEVEGPAHAAKAVAEVPDISCLDDNHFCTDKSRPNNANALAFMEEVLTQLAAISSSPLISVGLDEADAVGQAQYSQWAKDMENILEPLGKTAVGWTPSPSGFADPDSVHQYWRDQTSDANSTMSCDWFDDQRRVILSPPGQAYLDGQGPADALGNYDWDPSSVRDDYRNAVLQDEYCLQNLDIIGIEGASWAESTPGLEANTVRELTSMAALIEKAWSPQEKTGDGNVFAARLAYWAARWNFAGARFRQESRVPWVTRVAGSVLRAGMDGRVGSAELAGLSAAKGAREGFTATVDWGDGSEPEPVVISGSNPSSGVPARDSKAATLFTVSGSHTYAPGQSHTGTVTFTDGRRAWSATFEVVAPWRLDGFEPPVRMGSDVVNTVSAGSTVPLRFKVYRGAEAMTSGIGAVLTTQKVGCDGSDLQEPLEELPTTGSTQLRYDGSDGHWIQNWATPIDAAGSCYRVSLTTADGSSIGADFRLK
ncbi:MULTISPECIES: family 20 glycosylhydrolase [unclassified Nocardioides]|uniref:family 20 glycosylhydrolase n=1 Tax=unclassified Nocardioides TaxID=2615069 RepID=UPI00361EDFD7